MVLKKEMLTKTLKKGRLTAVNLLNQISRAGSLPEPHFDYEPGGSVKKPSHFFKVRFRVPNFLVDNERLDLDSGSVVVGAGKCRSKQFAKSLAALEVVHRLEEGLNAQRGGLQKMLDDFVNKQKQRQEEIESTPVEKEISGVSWENLPLDPSFAETLPASRRGRIDFSHSLMANEDAYMAAKALTISSEQMLPEVAIHANQTDIGILQRWANIRSSSKIQNVSGPIGGRTHDLSMGADSQEAEILALMHTRAIMRKQQQEAVVEVIENAGNASFGMAKLFVQLPKHQFMDLKELVNEVDANPIDVSTRNEHSRSTRRRRKSESIRANDADDSSHWQSRLSAFRKHQQDYPLPIDSVEDKIPHNAMVTIVRGGTGSGKTTRYPLMLSLFSPSGPSTKVMVVQPRRLACQTAARRVAYEQGYEIGSSSDCPIGYAIRFESFPSRGTRTVDFRTPGVLLRSAMDDPLLEEVTHLCIDEVHERNADIDLLLALAKQVIERRANHKTLPPLHLVLMSATLEASHWESFFGNGGKQDIAFVDVPDTRRFPIDIVHLGEPSFPKKLKSIKALQNRDSIGLDHDEALCQATAELASTLFKTSDLDGGSILCFLPGMDEIRLVDRLLRQYARGKQHYTVRYLHSSLSSKEQAKVFLPGPKVILSTNLAETSVTIPDVKVVIDTGRERQFSLLESTEDSTTVVGSQLATVNISQASAKQRAGRAGRVSAGTCYRLYSLRQLEDVFAPYTLPEMLRMDLSQLLLHSLSFYHPTSGHPLSLLLGAPDPPSPSRLKQTVRGLTFQGLVDCGSSLEQKGISLTPLGRAVSSFPASPRLGRMLVLGLSLRALEPGLQIAALLSVPKVFQSADDIHRASHSSDIVLLLEDYQSYLDQNSKARKDHPRDKLYRQVHRVQNQLEENMKSFLKSKIRTSSESENVDLSRWNENGRRVSALAGLICCATPHIAHLVRGKAGFSTRDVAAKAKIHPSSVNFDNSRRVHWYVYNELRTTKQPYMHVTTAVSPLELALFAEASTLSQEESDSEEDIDSYSEDDEDYSFYGWDQDDKDHSWLFIADQWIPVEVSKPSQRDTFLKLRNLLMGSMLQQVSQDPEAVLEHPEYKKIVLFVLSALDQQRLSK
jgi:HrpA-like RNA helicase